MQWLRKDDNHHRLSFLWAGTRGGAGDRAGMSCPCSVTPGAGTILRAFHAHVELPAPASVHAGGSWQPRWTVGRNTPTWPLHVAWAPARHGGEVRTEPGRSLLPRRTWPPKPRTVAATKITDPAGLKGRKRRPAWAWGASAASRVPGRVCRASEVGVRAPPRTANAPDGPLDKGERVHTRRQRRRDSLPEMVFPAVTWTGEQPRLSHTVTVSVSLARLSPPGGEFPEGGHRILHPLRASNTGTSALKTPRSRRREGPSSRALGWQ